MLTSLQNVFTCVTFYAVVLASFWYIMTKKKKTAMFFINKTAKNA